MRPGLVSLNSCQEKDVGGLSKKGNTARTTQIANISTFNQKANRMKYSVSDTLDPAQNTLHIHDPLTCTYTACACVDKTCRHGTGMTTQITHNARHPFDSMSTPLHNPHEKTMCSTSAVLQHLETAHSGCLCTTIQDEGFIISTIQ